MRKQPRKSRNIAVCLRTRGARIRPMKRSFRKATGPYLKYISTSSSCPARSTWAEPGFRLSQAALAANSGRLFPSPPYTSQKQSVALAPILLPQLDDCQDEDCPGSTQTAVAANTRWWARPGKKATPEIKCRRHETVQPAQKTRMYLQVVNQVAMKDDEISENRHCD